MADGSRLALALVARDEERMIADNLRYHRALGVGRAWVFLDRCTDRTGEEASRFPWVTVLDRPRSPDEVFLTDYQQRVMAEAHAFAAAEGWRWLLHLDPDELARGRGSLAARAGGWLRPRLGTESLPHLLASLPAAVEQVVLPPAEVVVTRRPAGEPFWRLPWVTRTALLPRRVLDPSSGEVRRVEGGYGHDKGKAIVRTDRALVPVSAHRWRRADGGDAVTVRRGLLYHFVVTGPGHWRDKYRRLADDPDRWRNGAPVRFPKQAWKEAATAMPEEEARRYFEEWVAVGRRELLVNLLRGRVLYDPWARRVLDAARRAPP